ncbi:MAG: immunoglobulin-like domain-containing protein [Minisyncoccia bacterium]
MQSKNKKIMRGMRVVAVLSILSMTVFSSSFNVAYASTENRDFDKKSYDESPATALSADKDEQEKGHKDKESDIYSYSDNSHDSYKDKNEDHEDGEKNNKGGKRDKITICHATHSETNPYITITISVSGEEAHKHHQDTEDIIPAPKEGCPKGKPGHGDNNGHKNTAPIISLIGSSTVYLYVGQTYTDLGANASDKEDGDITSSIVSISNVDTTKVGTYTVTYDVMDSKDLCAETVTRTVVVKPASEINTAPVITLLGLNPTTLYQGDIYLDAGATAEDHEDGNITTSIVKTGSVDRNTVGTYTITYNVKDSKGLSATTVIRTVNVLDRTNPTNNAPVITLIGSSTISITVGDAFTNPGATANDLEDGDITSNIITTGTVNSGVVGTYTISYNVKDSKGLSATTVTRTVNVLERINPTNNAPVITLIGLNPITITIGDTFVDPGATAEDHEDGNITTSIVKTGSVDVNTVGTYTITYNVKDSKDLSATAVTRTVNVIPVQTINKGKITFCLVLANDQNSIATSSYALPQGTFTLNLATTTSNIASTTIRTQTWNSETFSPNRKTILNQNDSDCVTYDNLEYGDYLYSSVAINGASWNDAKYSDQNNQPVNNVFDFFPYGNTNTNSDGVIVLGSERYERTLYVYVTYKPASQCLLPEVTSALTANTIVNQSFTYTLSASSTSSVSWEVASTSLPAGVTFATSTNTISGVPTTVGTYVVGIKAVNACGYDEKNLTINVANNTGGGGGGSTPTSNLSVVKTSNKSSANVNEEITYTISLENKGPDKATNVKVKDILPSVTDFLSATTTIGSYSTTTSEWIVGDLANGSTTSLQIIVKVKSGTEGQKISNTASVTGNQSDSDNSNNSSTVDVNVNSPAGGGGNGGGGGGGGGGGSGGNGPIVGSYGGGSSIVTSSGGIASLPKVEGCNYLLDYLRVDFKNNPVEVIKLQAFLKNLEGFSDLQITGVYDKATIDAVNVFQTRYKDDVLTPWGHTGPTSYVYILTKKKVNEIYCKLAFPVTAEQQLEIDSYRNSKSTFPKSSNVVNNEVGYGMGGSNVEEENKLSSLSRGTTTSTVKASNSATNSTATTALSNLANVGLTTLAGFSSSTKGVASEFIASIASSLKNIGSLIGALFTLPQKLFGGSQDNICKESTGVSTGVSLLLLILLAIVTYLWYREYRNNRKIEEINKEIDLQ